MGRPEPVPRRTLVIAEIGENHGGDWDLARRMVKEAARAGADIVKFQSYSGSDVAPDDPEKEWFSRVELPDALHFELRALAEQHGTRFLTSAFSVSRARFLLEELGAREVKIASSEMLNVPLLEYVNGRASAVFLSTGMATLDEVAAAVRRLREVPTIHVLQCTTQYPCPPEEANLSVIPELRRTFPQVRVGFSDHTIGTLAAVAAVALGAEVVEKHFTLDKSLPGTDHILSATPDELREMIRQIRAVETLLGSPVKEPTPSERLIVGQVRARFPK
jgi:N,N'-diacetyllegionaminate synthase